MSEPFLDADGEDDALADLVHGAKQAALCLVLVLVAAIALAFWLVTQ